MTDTPPVRHFEVQDLADVVVIAGPNGVGKTRLMDRLIQLLRGDQGMTGSSVKLEATSPEELDSWGKNELDLSVAEDMNLYRGTLHTNRMRRNWRSSVLQFESDRSIQKLQPLQFAWDLPNPAEEEVGWDFGFQHWKNRWQDTVHAMFKMIEHQKQSIANRAVALQRDGHDTMNLNFSDPMEPFKRVFARLLGPKELVDPAARRQRLEYITDGQTLDISTLSSGEREVVNIAFDYLLRQPADCIVFFDEPELHLHPELSHRLIQTLQDIGERNQLILSTHSPDIISGSLDKSVVFVSPPKESEDEMKPTNQAIPVSEDDETNRALRMLGHSIGIIALGRSIVLVEGDQSSVDKETYGAILGSRYPELVLVPSGGRHVIQSFELVHEAVLSKSLWGVEFFMLCDRDSAPGGGEGGRLRVLPRYHLENYFLDEEVWAEAFSPMEPSDSWLRDPEQIRAVLREVADEFVSYSTALAVSAEIRREAGNVDLMPKGVHEVDPTEVDRLLLETAEVEIDRMNGALDQDRIRELANGYAERLRSSLEADDDRWKADIPGKPVLATFASRAGMHAARMRKLYLNAATVDEDGPFEEVLRIFEDFSRLDQQPAAE